MTPEAQRIAIATACGWARTERDADYDWHRPRAFGGGYSNSLPDYLTDLNAMHDAEKVMFNEQRRYYARMLVQVHPLQYDPTNPGPLCHDGGAMNLFLIASMTAAQRAEAFLRTLGKWDDSK